MEWVETTARTIEEAKELALDRLGVAEDEAEFDILEEPRAGLFGRVRGEARVRARVRPTHPRPKAERRERRPRRPAGSPAAASSPDVASPDVAPSKPASSKASNDAGPVPTPVATTSASPRKEKGVTQTTDESPSGGDERERAIAFLETLSQAFGTPAVAVSSDAEDGAIEVRLDGGDLGMMIGPRGQTLLAIQDLTRLAAQRSEHATRLRIDIGGYREKRREALVRFTEQVARDVVASGSARRLEPMSAADRKVVHDAAGQIDGVTTTSEGEDPNRRVVILPAP
jgi:spoIIIJ-associated protein